MPFNTALSGVRAASKDLSVTGNNIANASTTGFKSSRAEFGDLYASSVLGSGANATGSGVRLQDVAQNFKEGSISFTENNLDMAISGSGFFMLNRDGENFYSRAGTFGLDKAGYIVGNSGGRLQGYPADGAGNLSGLRGDLRIETSNLSPRQTTNVQSVLNLDSTSEVLHSEGVTFQTTGTAVSAILADPSAGNGYPSQSITVTDPSGNVSTYTSDANASAAVTASELNSMAGISATATTEISINASISGPTEFNLNGVPITAGSLEGLANEINSRTRSSLPGISAALDASGQLRVTSATGHDLTLSLNAVSVPADTVTVNTASTTNGSRTLALGDEVIVGGSISVIMEDGYSVANADAALGLFGDLGDQSQFGAISINAFNPDDPSTYNSATSTTVYDSLGNPHVMTQYFVRQHYDPTDATSRANHWEMHVQIDGQDVGDPNPTLPAPANTIPTRASFDVVFNQDGTLNEDLSDPVLISNWTPLDQNGRPNGAMGPQNVLAGGSLIIPDPPMSSNFVLSLDGTTQFNEEFGEYAITQDGYTTGRLSALNIDDQGRISARFTNGQSQLLGQIVLAKFSNEQGLDAMGDTMWSETSDSGQPNISTPGSSDLGSIKSGALEGSNVDLSEQLVNLIVAQRNFQANAKTIETADQTTQTIINLR